MRATLRQSSYRREARRKRLIVASAPQIARKRVVTAQRMWRAPHADPCFVNAQVQRKDRVDRCQYTTWGV